MTSKPVVPHISGQFATKDDLTSIKIDIADFRYELKLMKWMFVIIAAGIISLLLKS